MSVRVTRSPSVIVGVVSEVGVVSGVSVVHVKQPWLILTAGMLSSSPWKPYVEDKLYQHTHTHAC